MYYSGIEDSCGINYLLKELPEASGICDVGSYDGGDALLLKQHYPLAEVHSIEASPSLFKQIHRIPNINWHNLAIGKEEGLITLQQSYINDGQMHCATKYIGNALTYHPFEVQQTRLDKFWEKHGKSQLDLLWIDVDGMDYEVLQGLGSLRPELISFEHNGREWWDEAPIQSELYYLIGSYGYNRIWENHHTCVWRKK